MKLQSEIVVYRCVQIIALLTKRYDVTNRIGFGNDPLGTDKSKITWVLNICLTAFIRMWIECQV